MAISEYGTTKNGQVVHEISLHNSGGFCVKILTYGGALTAIDALNHQGYRSNVVLAYKNLEDYEVNPMYLGVIVGRTAGRTAKGEIVIDGQMVHLDTTSHPHALHGGENGLHQQVWTVLHLTDDTLILGFTDREGQGKTPGTLDIKAHYKVLEPDALEITYSVTTDAKTYVNLTNHSYFNLCGSSKTSVLDHQLTLKASCFAPVDNESIPLESLQSVANTPFDFRLKKVLRQAVESQYPQIVGCHGIDHPFQLDEKKESIVLTEPLSRRMLTINTNQKFVVIYSGNFLDQGQLTGGEYFRRYEGICFETQDIPNGPNRSDFDGHYLEPGQIYRHETCYTFSLYDTLTNNRE